MKRRELIKYLSVAPLAGAAAGSVVPQSLIAATAKAKVKRDLIKELGLRTFINAAGTLTTHTASLMHEDTVEAINVASKQFMMIRDVQDKVGAKIAELCHSESAMVTAGCWSALVLGTAGVLTGTDRQKIRALPDVSKLAKNEVIVQRGQNAGYVHALTNTGIIPVVIDTRAELEKAINPKTAMMYFLNEARENKNGTRTAPIEPMGAEEWVEVAKKYNIPTLIDIAADVPPVENLWKFNDMGFSLVCVSGGKGLRGPQSAGILMGKKDLIQAARLNAPPDGDNIGRGMKVNKEEILGMYAALDAFIKQDHEKVWKMWEDRVAYIQGAIGKFKGVTAKLYVPPIANHTPHLAITLDPALVKMTTRELTQKLRAGTPSIELWPGPYPAGVGTMVAVFMLQPGEEKIIATRMVEELSKVATKA
jgi:uncharacterized pyridoxal phosphate-dependent enzyme